jgi:maltooligosyltrehalose trehalohydrolase
VLTGAFFHDGAWSSFRRRHHGRPVVTAALPGWKFLGYLQDHDQIGNRAVGDRISASLSPGLLAVGATLVLTSPFTPMLFMGEEWGAGTPWQFFTSHPEPELGRATAEGRIGEFAEHGWDADVVPDPQDPETFTRSKLDWSELSREPHARLLDVHRTLLALRKAQPELVDPDLAAMHTEFDEDRRWLVVHRGTLRVVVNLSDRPREIELDRPATGVVFCTADEPTVMRSTVTVPAESAAVLTTR